MNPLVDILAQFGDRALRNSGKTHGLHQIIDFTG